jgi:RNA polymerase sigma factor (sigma-70 family)
MTSFAFNNNNNNHVGTRKRRRGHGLFGLVCVSLCANSSTGFVNLMHPSRQQQQQQLSQQLSSQSQLSVMSSSSSSASSFMEHPEIGSKDFKHQVNKNRRKTMTTTFARLTPEEETELLGSAVEYRRLNQLEKDLAMANHNSLPLLSVRAKHAGYGEDLDGYEDAKYEGQLARETLVTHNMGLVHHCVNQIIGRETKSTIKNGLPLNSLAREDLLQEGAIGLARAVDKWNPEIGNGNKFSTYAVYWVRAAVLRCIAERDDVVRVPSHVSQAVLQINKAAKRLGWVLQESGGILVTERGDGGKSVTLSKSTMTMAANNNNNSNIKSPRWEAANAAKRLAEEAGLSEKHFEEAMKARRRRYSGGYVPFESWMQKTSKKNGGASILSHQHQSDENADHDKEHLESSNANEEIRTVLSKHLRPKEMEALSWRYGLLSEEDQRQHDESILDRANRQFLEMEDQLFGPSAAAVNVAVAASAPTLKASLVQPKAKTKRAVKPLIAAAAAATPLAKGRFGEAMTFTEVGKKMQVSAEYTRRLCHKALNKLQQAAADGTLEPALLF